MDFATLILIPLLAGYIFAVLFPPSSYNAAREEGHKLYFRAMFYGLFIFSSAILLSVIFTTTFPETSFKTKAFIVELSELAFQEKINDEANNLIWLNGISILFAIFIGIISNSSKRFKMYIYKKAIKYDDIERIITRAVTNGFPISISMKNGKVYVGFIETTIDPKETRKDIRILPLMSGYRDKDTNRIEFTTNYHSIYESNDESISHLNLTDFEIAFPLSELLSINLFDINAYNKFQHISE